MGIFDNANKVMINNKEVQSLKIGTAVLYEKSSPTSKTLFEDACSSNANLSKYGSPISLYNTSISGTQSMTYNSSNVAYELYGSTSNDYVYYPISDLDGKDDFTFEMEVKLNNSTNYPRIGLTISPSTSDLSSTYSDNIFVYRSSSSRTNCYSTRIRRTATSNQSTGYVSQNPTNWTKIKVVFSDTTSYVATWETTTGSVLKTYNGTLSTTSKSDRHYGIHLRGNGSNYLGYIRNIKAERND